MRIRSAILLLAGFAFFVLWYVIAADYDAGMFAGTYVFHDSHVAYELHLGKDGSYEESVSETGLTKKTSGTWRRIGEGGAAFEGSFIPLPGQESHSDGSVYGYCEKYLTLWPYIRMAPDQTGPVLHRKVF